VRLTALRAGNIGLKFSRFFGVVLRHLLGVMFSHFFEEALENMAATFA
jgi:hypothetical protein